MNNKSIFAISLLFLFTCCKQQPTGKPNSIDNEYVAIKANEYVTIKAGDKPFDIGKELELSSFVDSMSIIPLELTAESMLKGEISKVEIFDDNILLIERRNPECVYRFDINGKFLNRIGNKGQGPEEVVGLANFCIDEDSGVVFLYDRPRQSMVSYDLDGKFLNSQIFHQYYSKIEFQDGLFYLFEDQPYKNDSYCLEIKDVVGKPKNRFFPSKQYNISSYTKTFNKQSDCVLFHRGMNDTIYQLKGDKLAYAYYIDFGPYRLTPKEIDDIYSERTRAIDILMNKGRVAGLESVFRTTDFLFFSTVYKAFNFFYIYDLKKGELTISGASLFDDLNYIFNSNASFFGQTEDALIGVYQLDSFREEIDYYDTLEEKGYITSEKKQELRNKMLALSKGNIDEMNPWILLYHIKKSGNETGE